MEGGRWAAKATVGEQIPVRACVFTDGHQQLRVVARWRMLHRRGWTWTPLQGRIDDFWTGNLVFPEVGAAEFQIEAWRDAFGSWRSDYRRWLKVGVGPLEELPSGLEMVRQGLERLPSRERELIRRRLQDLQGASQARLERFLLSPDLYRLMERSLRARPGLRSEALPVWVERTRALYGAWYEMFPRSEGSRQRASGTFVSAAKRLPALAAMGFDVLYLPPIHPVGETARRGRNNAPRAEPGDPGSPWAIGSARGGHTAVNPELGDMDDFLAFQQQARDLGLELALDYALQCSPDHPWVKLHPNWFEHRPDGSIRTAENPPKRYDDVLPLDFECQDHAELWQACYEILEFWIERGVRIFRVDNPHTKPMLFWAWTIGRLRREHPEVILLAEAFTKPALMEELSKVGFSQSYTYFTWRTRKAELTSYMTQLSNRSADFLRPNFFTNTPDILTAELQAGGPPVFRERLVLAATLSPSYGIFSGFELFENQAREPRSEEYLDSDKYQFRQRDWRQAGPMADLITELNRIRRQHPALHQLRRIRFHSVADGRVIAFSKHTADRSDVVLVIVNLDPGAPRSARLTLSLSLLGIRPGASFRVHDLLQGGTEVWNGRRQLVRLGAEPAPALIYWVEP